MQIWKQELPKFLTGLFMHSSITCLYLYALSSQMGVLITKTITSASVQINSATLHIIYAMSHGFITTDCKNNKI
jgi:hypothetical protein